MTDVSRPVEGDRLVPFDADSETGYPKNEASDEPRDEASVEASSEVRSEEKHEATVEAIDEARARGSSLAKAERARTESFANDVQENAKGTRPNGLSAQVLALLAEVPVEREAKSGWRRKIARNEEIALHLVGHLGIDVDGLEIPFPCVLHPNCSATLTQGDNGVVVYKDPTLAPHLEFQTIPALFAATHTGKPAPLTGIQQALWGSRLLFESGLMELPLVDVPEVLPESPQSVRLARDGFELLVRCRWWGDPGAPVAFARRFVTAWCGVPEHEARQAIEALRAQGVIVRTDEATNSDKRWKPTFLYKPGRGSSAGGSVLPFVPPDFAGEQGEFSRGWS